MKAETAGRSLLRSIHQPDLLAKLPLAAAYFQGLTLDEGHRTLIDAVRWCLKPEARLLYIFEACDIRREAHKKAAADLHLTRRHFYRLRNALIERIESALPAARSSLAPPVTLGQIDALLRLIDVDASRAAREQIESLSAGAKAAFSLTIGELHALVEPERGATALRVMREDAAASDTDAALAQAIRARRLLASGFSDADANALHRALRPAVLGETPYLRSSCFSELGAHYHRTGNISDMIRAFQDGFNVLLEQGSAHAVTCEAQTVLASAKLASVDWCESAVVDMLSVFERLATQDISSPRAYAYMIFAYVNKTILNYSAAREYASRSALECQPFSDARAAAILSGAARIEAALGDPDTALEWAERARRNAPELPMIELRAADVASHIPRIGPVHVHQRSSGGCAQHAHYDGSRLLIEARSERADKRRRSALLRDALSGLRRGAPLHELHDALDLLTAEGQIASAERQERREMLEIFKKLRSKYAAELPRPLAHSA